MINQQFEECRDILDHISYLLSDAENLELVIKSKVDAQAERYNFCIKDILYVFANLDYIEPKPPGYHHENCFLVTGFTIDDIRLNIVLVESLDSMRIRILNAWT